MPAHAHPRLTVGLTGRGWSRLEALLWELSHLLGEAGLAMQLGSWARAGGTLGPEGGFILRGGGPFLSPQRRQEHRALRMLAAPSVPTFLHTLPSLLASCSYNQCGPSLGLVAALCPVKHKEKDSVTVMVTHSHRVCPHL